MTTAARRGNTTTYAYDNAGQRVRKAKNAGTGSTVIFVYDLSGQLLGEYDSAGDTNTFGSEHACGDVHARPGTRGQCQYGCAAGVLHPCGSPEHAQSLGGQDEHDALAVDERAVWDDCAGTPAGQAALTFDLRFLGSSLTLRADVLQLPAGLHSGDWTVCAV
ncbi:MAG: hypothetical protein IPJ18_21895 [Betaproteobacteria bacterium]|nr:hypothetical protein [Betaproteobacteria bacterium]